jgi:cobalt-zinc-cadmium efflux system outer membrane protein
MRANVLAMVMCATAFGQNSMTLEDLERMALTVSPSIKERAADVQAAAGRARQAGFYPNPVLGASGDHVAGGPIQRGGDLGGFVEQRVVTAGKLSLARRAGDQMRQAAEQEQAAEQLRVLTAIRRLYYQALGEQRLIAIRSDLAELAERAAKTQRELANLGQADQPDVLTADVEAQRAQLAVTMARNALAATWRKIAATIDRSDAQPAVLDGDWDALPKLEEATELGRIYAASPQLRAAQANRAAAALRLRRERVEAIPDVMLRGGVRDNRALVGPGLVGAGSSTNLGTPAGIEGFFDVGVQIPLFHGNQGNVTAAAAESERARFDELRVRQALAVRFAGVYRGYRDAVDSAARYRDSMLPAARQAYEMYQANFGNMAAPYARVLLAQRNLFQLEEEYVAAVMAGWSNVVEMEGLLADED